jgi:MFS family permease
VAVMLGYDIGVMAGAIILMQQDLNLSTPEKEVALGCLNFVSGVGAILTSELIEFMGSPKSMAWCLGLYILGMANVAVADGIKSLLFGRIVTGLGVGIGIAVCPQYIAEISPTGACAPHRLFHVRQKSPRPPAHRITERASWVPRICCCATPSDGAEAVQTAAVRGAEHRGVLVACFEVSLNLGLLLGYASSLAFYEMPIAYGWRAMIGIALPPAVLCFVGTFYLPQSPRWLYNKGKVAQAEETLLRCVANNRRWACSRHGSIATNERAGKLVANHPRVCYAGHMPVL